MTNFHTHSTWCDGKDSPAAMAEAAFRLGFSALGFSSHAMLPGEPLDWTLSAEKIPGYRDGILRLKPLYAGKMDVFLGVEADFVKGRCFPDRPVYSALSPDYIIGSVHFVVSPGGGEVMVDESPASLSDGIAKHYGGDARAYVKDYFAQQRQMALSCDFDVIGHPDLVRKFNGRLGYFDESSPWYDEELEMTADAFAQSGKIVEVNTGGIARGWIDDAYPSPAFRAKLRRRGVRFILSSDAHSAQGLDCAFGRFGNEEEYLQCPWKN
ncbi:MAG: histidinol-phosphatase [Kiritimatiellae bacterium]|nr:histidinol-phosphatase [Kiritimatiellia bacterium]